MTTFWKPLADDSARLQPGMQVKQLGARTFALWARCDACFASGAFHFFSLWERGTEVGTLCFGCGCRDEITRELRADGWTFLG